MGERRLAGKGPLAVLAIARGFVPVGNVPSDQVQAFTIELRRALRNRKLIVSSDLLQTSTCSTQLLITAPGGHRTQLFQLSQKPALQGTPLAGWVLLDPELKLS